MEKLLLAKTTPQKPELSHPVPTLHPLHYKLQIHPTLQENFTGIVKILLHCVNKTERIVLNVEDLHINAESVKIFNATIRNQSYDKSKLIYIITLKAPLEVNANYTLHVEFSGNISDDFAGIYRTIDSKNKSVLVQ